MIIFAFISLIAALLSLFLGNYVLYLNPKKSLNRLFFALSICIFYWGFVEFGCRQAESYSAARIWLICMSLWPVTVSVSFHFILVFTEKTRILAKRFTNIIIYFPAIVFSIVYFLMSPEVRGPIKVYWGWTFNLPREWSIYLFAHIWVFAVAVFSLATAISYHINVIDLQKKQQAIYVFTGISIAITLGIITEIILPWMGIRVPELTTIGFFLANLFIGYAIWKYQLFTLTPMTAADNIISTMPDVLFLVDMENKILSVNNSALSILGYKEHEIIKQSINLVFKGGSNLIENIKKEGTISDVEAIILTKDQREISVSLAASIVTGRSNINFGIVFIARDITDRIRAEAALKDSEEKFKLIFENVNDGIVYLDPEGFIIEVNQKIEEIFGIERTQSIGKNFLAFDDMFKTDDFQNIQVLFNGIINEGVGPTLQLEMKNNQGSATIIETNARLIEKEQKLIGLLAIIKDITKRKKAEEEKKKLEAQLFKSQKMEALGTMASGVAHDFNNSLGSIVLNTEMSLEEATLNSELRHSLEQVLKVSRRAKKLVRQILTFSRDEEVDRKPVDLSGIVKETLDMLRSMLPTSIEIEQDIDSDIGYILADSTQIQQLVINLCSNSAHAMRDKGGKLEVTLKNVKNDTPDPNSNLGPGLFVKLMVKDSGHGIAPDIKERVFDPFFTTKSMGEGTGLGLSVVHGIVASHEGAISLDTEVGKGTIFTVHFPKINHGVAKAAGKEAPLSAGNESILFVDDEADLVDATTRVLSRLGYHVHGVTSAMEALKLFEMHHDQFDIVITDVTMPHMNGIEFSKALLKIQPDIPIVICTGFSNLMKPEVIKKIGIKDYIMKPFVAREMAEKIRKVLDQAGH